MLIILNDWDLMEKSSKLTEDEERAKASKGKTRQRTRWRAITCSKNQSKQFLLESQVFPF